MALELGLTKRGFTVVRDIVLESTGDADTDALLERMARSLSDVTPPFRSAKRTGPVAGAGPGSCTPKLIEIPPSNVPVDDADGDPAGEDTAST